MRRPAHLVLALCVLSLPVVRAQAACDNAFANFTTCTVLNGVPADGDFVCVKKTLAIEAEVLLAYSKDNMITRNDACKQVFAAFECVQTTNHPQQSFVTGKWVDLFSAPCKSDGLRLKPCYEWCVKFQQTCYTRTQTGIEFECTFSSAEQGGVCFGDNGVRGMLPPPPSSSTVNLAHDDLATNVIALAAAVSLAGISNF